MTNLAAPLSRVQRKLFVDNNGSFQKAMLVILVNPSNLRSFLKYFEVFLAYLLFRIKSFPAVL